MRLRASGHRQPRPRLDKKNEAIESQLIGYLQDPDFDIRLAALAALGERGDPAPSRRWTALLNSNDITSGIEPIIEDQLARLKNKRAVEPATIRPLALRQVLANTQTTGQPTDPAAGRPHTESTRRSASARTSTRNSSNDSTSSSAPWRK